VWLPGGNAGWWSLRGRWQNGNLDAYFGGYFMLFHIITYMSNYLEKK
jgi:hypothetical protein